MTELVDDIIAVRQLLSDPNRWCQRTMAANAKGRGTLFDQPEAVRWCLLGAICKVTYTDRLPLPNYKIVKKYLNDCVKKKRQTCSEIFPMELAGLEAWNDANGRTHEEIINFLDEAIVGLLEEA